MGFILVYFVLYESFRDCHIKIFKSTALSSGHFCQIYRVTDAALIAETAVWLMNIFFALKGSKLFIIITMEEFFTVVCRNGNAAFFTNIVGVGHGK